MKRWLVLQTVKASAVFVQENQSGNYNFTSILLQCTYFRKTVIIEVLSQKAGNT